MMKTVLKIISHYSLKFPFPDFPLKNHKFLSPLHLTAASVTVTRRVGRKRMLLLLFIGTIPFLALLLLFSCL